MLFSWSDRSEMVYAIYQSYYLVKVFQEVFCAVIGFHRTEPSFLQNNLANIYFEKEEEEQQQEKK
jgi:hypothetical protein